MINSTKKIIIYEQDDNQYVAIIYFFKAALINPTNKG